MNHQWDIKRYSLRHIVFSWPPRHSFSGTSFCWPPSSAIKHSFHPLCLEVSVCSIPYLHLLLRHLLSSSHWACYTHSCLLLYYLSCPSSSRIIFQMINHVNTWLDCQDNDGVCCCRSRVWWQKRLRDNREEVCFVTLLVFESKSKDQTLDGSGFKR